MFTRKGAFLPKLHALLVALALAGAGRAQATTPPSYLPSIKIGTAALISPTDANTYYGGNTASTDLLATLTGNPTPVPVEIVHLAGALKNDPDLIYQYVENNIQTVWMYGLQKGALGAEIDKSGTPFDQAVLMVALLRQAGVSASYVAGTVLLNQTQFTNWTGISDALAACQLLSSGGIPAQINGNAASTACSSFTAGTAITSVRMAHIWVQATIGSTAYVFDPSYKTYTWKPGIDLQTATGLSPGDPLGAAIGGMSHCTVGSGPACVNTLNAGSLNTKLQTYTTSYLNYLQTNHLQGAQMEDIVGGGVIQPATTALRQTTLPYADPSPPYAAHVWTPPTDAARYNAIPDQYRTSLRTVGKATEYLDTTHIIDALAFDATFYVDQIYGRKLWVDTDFNVGMGNYQNNTITLKLEGAGTLTYACQPGSTGPCWTNVAPDGFGGASTRGLPAHIQLTATHPYAAAADGSPSATGGYMNASLDKPVMFLTPLAIVHGWGDTSQALFTKWSNEDNRGTAMPPVAYPPFCAGGTEPCHENYLKPTGDVQRTNTEANWLGQMTRAAQLNAAIAHSVSQIHHVLGFVYADSVLLPAYYRGPDGPASYVVGDSFDRVDVDMAMSLTSKTASAIDRRVALQSIAASAAALEGSISAQASDAPDTSSTATRFEWANSPPASEHAPDKQNPNGLPPQNFYEFNSANASQAATLVQVEGSHCPGGSFCGQDNTTWGAPPQLTTAEITGWQNAFANGVADYAAQGFDVVGAQEAFLGPGQRGGAVEVSYLHGSPSTYTHVPSKQRGGAFVATQYDPTCNPTTDATCAPLQIAHIQTGLSTDQNNQPLYTKGGGGGVQPGTIQNYDPADAADILKSQFVDRSNALGVNLSNGSASYTSPASLSVGNGGFPYRLSAELTLHQAPGRVFAPPPPVPPGRGWVSNWQNNIAISGSGFEAMGQSDIRAAAGTIAAFLSAQDIYRTTLKPEREVAGVLAMSWWSDQLSGNVATVAVGAGTKQLVHLPTTASGGIWIQPGPDYSTIVQTGQRVPGYQDCSYGFQAYVMSRGWDYTGVSFDVTSAGGDVQHFVRWEDPYYTDDDHDCAEIKGFRMTTWTFPQGPRVTLSYGNPYDPLNSPGSIEQLIGVTNNLGRSIVFNTSDGQIQSITNGLTGTDLRQVTVTYPGFLEGSYPTSMTDPLGNQTSFLYDQTGCTGARPTVLLPQLSYVFTADKPDSSNLANANTEYTYDCVNQVAQVYDAVAIQKGTRGPYSFYLADGTRGERDDPLGQAYAVGYDTYGHPSRFVDEVGHETDALFDGRGRVQHYLYPEGDCEVFDYDDHNNTTDRWKVDTASGCNTGAGTSHVLHSSAAWDQGWNKPTSVTDARGYTTTLQYYPSGVTGASLLQTATRPAIAEGTPVYRFDYDALGRPLDLTGPTGIVTRNTYSTDGFDNLLSTAVDYGSGSGHQNLTTQFVTDARGDVTATTDPRGFVVTSLYDADRRKTEDDRHNGDASAVLLAASRVLYDAVGRDKEDDAGTAFSGTSVTTWQTMKQTAYTPTSKVASVTDADGKVTTSHYDDGDRTITVTDPVGRAVHDLYCAPGDATCAANQVKTEYRAWEVGTACSRPAPSLQECYRRVAYLPDGEQQSVTDANGNITTYAYDGWVRLNRTNFPDSGPLHPDFEQLTLDANGNVTSRQTRRGDTLTYQYNALDWMTGKVMPKAPSGSVTTAWTYLLDGRTNVLSDDNGSGDTLTYGYDGAGRMTSVATKVPSLPGTKTTSYTLDAGGNRTKLTWPGTAYYVGYCYDALGRMTAAMENSTSSGCATNLLATYQYDALSRRTNLAYAGGSGATITYPSYSNAGDLKTLTHDLNGSANDNTFTYSYTDAHQTQTAATTNAAWFWQPPADNATSYTPNNLNQYATVAGTTYSYDGNGNLTSDGTWALGYDAENRLLAANKTAGGTVSASYVYDSLGRRVHKSGTGVTETFFLDDGTDEIAEYDGTHTMTTRYIPGPAIDEPIATVNASTGAKAFFHTDRQGSVVATSDTTGALVEGPYTYDPYGNCFSGASPCAATTGEPYRFTGRRLDAETGFYYYRARYYAADDTHGGRFLQTDPVGYTADLNLYPYPGNDPVNKADPTGACPADVCKYGDLSIEGVNETFSDVDTSSGSAPSSVNARAPGPNGGVKPSSHIVMADAGPDEGGSLIIPEAGDADALKETQKIEDQAAMSTDTAAGDAENREQAAKAAGQDTVESEQREAEKANPGRYNLQFGSTKSLTRWQNQMTSRGWTEDDVLRTISTGKSFPATNNINPGNGATRYEDPVTGKSIVVDNKTGEVIHVGGAGFKY
jgi:RHS repeat-associated protein